MNYPNEKKLNPSQTHFLRSLLEGKREISEQEAEIRRKKLGLNALRLPCAVVCVSPYFTEIGHEQKDEMISDCSDYICLFLKKEKRQHFYCLTNAYDNYQIILPIDANGLKKERLDEVLLPLRQALTDRFGLQIYIGIGSVVDRFSDISRSALEAMEMLAFKNRYADRGVISVVNSSRFKHYSKYGEDITFARVIGRFQDGDLAMMSVRLEELIESIRKQTGISGSTIRRTFIELAVNILHIASDAGVDVDSVLNKIDVYNWILNQENVEDLTNWLLDLSAKLIEQIKNKQEFEEKQIIKQACDYVMEHLSDSDLSLQTVSEHAGLSCAYFSQLFKSEKGIGLISFITEARIAKAKEYLTESNLKSKDIALLLGFSTSTYFGRVFKKSTGKTPNNYRMDASSGNNR